MTYKHPHDRQRAAGKAVGEKLVTIIGKMVKLSDDMMGRDWLKLVRSCMRCLLGTDNENR